MKKLSLIVLCLIGLSGRMPAQVTLGIFQNGTILPTFTVSAGTAFSLDIDVADSTALALPISLDSFDLTFLTAAGSSAAAASSVLSDTSALINPAGPDFVVTQSKSHPNELSAYALNGNGSLGGANNDLSLTTTPTKLLTANFAGLSAGTYTIEFPGTDSFQNLYDASDSPIPYTATNFTLVVTAVPEPSMNVLFLTGLLVLAGWKYARRLSSI